MQLRLPLLISISLLALALPSAPAQTADDFFHGGARAYLTNNMSGATNLVGQGLKMFPEDVKLKKLDELLKQQKQQQQQNQQQQKQDQKNQSQSKQDQQQKDQQKQKSDDQKKKDEQKKQDQQKQQPPNQKPEQAKQGDDKDKDKKEQQGKPGEMTPEEAKRLLDSQKGDEALLPASQNKTHPREHSLKDW